MSTYDPPARIHALDAVRAFALLLGVVFHAGLSFVPGMPPGLWAIVDVSPSQPIGILVFTSHIFRMSLFFFIAGFFARYLFMRRGARGFWHDRAMRILLPLVVGWIVLFPMIAAVWVWGLTKTFGGTLPAPPAGAPAPPPGAFPLTHLWFLYYLLILYVVVLTLRWVLVRLDRQGSVRAAGDRIVGMIVRSGAAALLLPLPLAAALYRQPGWIAATGIPTPDQSLVPQVASLVAYGTAVAFGWLVHRQTDLLPVWRVQWPFHLAAAIGLTTVCLWMVGTVPEGMALPGLPRAAFALCYGVAIWCWSFAVIGLAQRVLSHAHGGVRYVADASYWIYLVHLPVVAALQVALGHLPWHWSLKFPLILAISLAVLFASYRYLVRFTFIGHVLNGRRSPRTSARDGLPVSPDDAPEAARP